MLRLRSATKVEVVVVLRLVSAPLDHPRSTTLARPPSLDHRRPTTLARPPSPDHPRPTTAA